jgi:hypothetical protein
LKAIKFLESYKWGSVANFLGKENYSCLMNKALFFDLFETDADTYKKNLLDWINDPKE